MMPPRGYISMYLQNYTIIQSTYRLHAVMPLAYLKNGNAVYSTKFQEPILFLRWGAFVLHARLF